MENEQNHHWPRRGRVLRFSKVPAFAFSYQTGAFRLRYQSVVAGSRKGRNCRSSRFRLCRCVSPVRSWLLIYCLESLLALSSWSPDRWTVQGELAWFGSPAFSVEYVPGLAQIPGVAQAYFERASFGLSALSGHGRNGIARSRLPAIRLGRVLAAVLLKLCFQQSPRSRAQGDAQVPHRTTT